MILYHGSPKMIEVPQYGFGAKENDYGLGFYCTQSNDLAKDWACPTVQSGFSNQYELNLEGLRVLHLNSVVSYSQLDRNSAPESDFCETISGGKTGQSVYPP